MKNTNEVFIVEAFSQEQFIHKLIQMKISPTDWIILKYLKDCLYGSQRVEDYKKYLVNQIRYNLVHMICETCLEKLTIKECRYIIGEYKKMIQRDEEFLKKNQYYLKPFPLYRNMRLDYSVEKWNSEHVYIPKLLEQIEENKKENETL